jgi:nicotinamidase-related amidase
VNAPARPRFDGAPANGSPTALLLLDWINPLAHEDAEGLREPARLAARTAAQLKRRLTDLGVQAIYANDNYGVWRSDFRAVLVTCLARGGASAEIARTLAPTSEDIAVLKARHSAFYETPLQLLLQQLGVRQLVLVGLATEWCVLFTAIDAYVRGYSLWVPQDCVASASGERHDAAVTYMHEVLGARVDLADRLEEVFPADAAAVARRPRDGQTT